MSRTYSDVERDSPGALSGDVELVPGEICVDDGIDEELAMKKKLAKQKQQSRNRGRSNLLGTDHKQTGAASRSELEPGYYIFNSGKKTIKVLHRHVARS